MIEAKRVHDHCHEGDILEVSAPSGNFTLRPGEGPVVRLSAGIGTTPVLAMLHALASATSDREIWWLYGARDGNDHPFARDSRGLLKRLPRTRSHIATAGQDLKIGPAFGWPLLDRSIRDVRADSLIGTHKWPTKWNHDRQMNNSGLPLPRLAKRLGSALVSQAI